MVDVADAAVAAGLAAPVAVAGADVSGEAFVEEAAAFVAGDQRSGDGVGNQAAVEGLVGVADDVVSNGGGDGSVADEFDGVAFGAQQGGEVDDEGGGAPAKRA